MNVKKENDDFNVKLSFEELIILHNSLNELCNNMRIANYQKLIDATRDELIAMLDLFGVALLSIEKQGRMEDHEIN